MEQTKLQWNEPWSKLRADWKRRRKENPSEPYKVGGIAFAVILLLRGLVELNAENYPNRPGWLAALELAAGVALFMAFIFPWFFYLIPGDSIVVISENGIGHQFFTGKTMYHQRYGWEDVGYCSVYLSAIDNREYIMFAIHDEGGNPLNWYALGKKVSVSDIDEWFRRYQKPLRRINV